jgi:hypothetical protein
MNNDFVNELYKDLTTAIAHPWYRQEDLYLVITKKIKSFEDCFALTENKPSTKPWIGRLKGGTIEGCK